MDKDLNAKIDFINTVHGKAIEAYSRLSLEKIIEALDSGKIETVWEVMCATTATNFLQGYEAKEKELESLKNV